MARNPQEAHATVLNLHSTEFGSGDIGLTLLPVSLVILIFVVSPLGKAALWGESFSI
jgi:hypothetical protein